MRTLTPGSLPSLYYKDTRVVILSEARASARSEEPAFLACTNELAMLRARSTWWDQASDLGRQGAVSRRRERAAHNPVLITLEQTDACDYRCRCSRCAVGVGVWRFDESRQLLRQQRSERQCQHNQLE